MFNQKVSIATNRNAIKQCQIINLTSLTIEELDSIQDHGDYVVIMQDINHDTLYPDRLTYHEEETQKWERIKVKVFYSLKAMEDFLNTFYKEERFIINALPKGTSAWYDLDYFAHFKMSSIKKMCK